MRKLDLEKYGITNKPDFEQIGELVEFLLEPRFTAKDLGNNITNRKINIWFTENLLMEHREKGKWRVFNFVEFCWIQIIEELRRYEIKYNIIRTLKENLLDSVEWLEILREPEYLSQLLELIPDNKKAEATEIFKNAKEISEEDTEIGISLLFVLILDCFIEKRHISICFNNKGDLAFVKVNKLDLLLKEKDFREFIHDNYFSISLSKIIGRLFLNHFIDEEKIYFMPVSEKEEEVIKKTRQANIKSINIRFDDKSNIDLIEVTKKENVDPSARLMDIIMSNEYQTITIKTEKGKIVKCENTRKYKIKNSGDSNNEGQVQ